MASIVKLTWSIGFVKQKLHWYHKLDVVPTDNLPAIYFYASLRLGIGSLTITANILETSYQDGFCRIKSLSCKMKFILEEMALGKRMGGTKNWQFGGSDDCSRHNSRVFVI